MRRRPLSALFAAIATVFFFVTACGVPDYEFAPDGAAGGGSVDSCSRPGFADCDGDAANGCEANTKTSAKHCGVCGRTCASGVCTDGKCTAACPTGKGDCDGDGTCETTVASDKANCGVCGNVCGDTNAAASCSGGKCVIQCKAGFGNCDEDNGTGCEAALTTVDRCGACGTSCKNDHGTTKCTAGDCAPVCAPKFADCDGNPNNGCETGTDANLLHCGACGKSCAPANADAACEAGVCKFLKCKDGFKDCDGDPENGCEADLTDIKTCGACDNSCGTEGSTTTCVPTTDGTSHECKLSCRTGFADCNGVASDGCEIDTRTNVQNCKTCGNKCPAGAGKTAFCSNSTCGETSCNDGFADCNGDGTCESRTDTIDNCGGCGIKCDVVEGTGTCLKVGANYECAVQKCNQGFADCNTADRPLRCEVKLGTATNCSDCGDACTNANGSTRCELADPAKDTDNACTPTCFSLFGDCDGNPNNGCEVGTNSVTNCGPGGTGTAGGCGVACAKANGTESCSTGVCEIVSCDANFASCDAESPVGGNGCEQRIDNNLANCGGCGLSCSAANGVPSCVGSACSMTSCTAPFKNCSANENVSRDGCETNSSNDIDNCGTCGTKCTTGTGTTTSCVNSVCTAVCNANRANCDGNAINGCESDLVTNKDRCGACNIDCDVTVGTTANTPSCVASNCTYASCKTGFSDCNSNKEDGCEKATSADVLACGGCTRPCSTANGATPSCSSSACQTPTCSGGRLSCDAENTAMNGCEIDGQTNVNNCGSCGNVCGAGANAGKPYCVAGACASQLVISVVDVATVGTGKDGANDLQIAYTLKRSRAQNPYRTVILAIGYQGNNIDLPPLSTLEGVSAKHVTASYNNQSYAAIQYWLDADLPAGASTVAITVPGNNFNQVNWMAQVIELSNVRQETLAAGSFGTSGAGGTACSAALNPISLVAVPSGAFIASVINANGTGTFTQGIGNTLINGALASGTSTTGVQYRFGAGANQQMIWQGCFDSEWSHAAAFFRPEGVP